MLQQLLKHPRALGLSLVGHVVVLGLVFVSLDFDDKPETIRAGQVEKTVQAEIVDQAALDARKKEQEDALRAKKEAEQRKKEAERKKKEQAAKKLAEAKRKQAEEKKKAEAKRKAEEKRKAELKQKKAAEEKRKAEAKRKAEEKRLAEEKRKKAEQERKRKEAEAKRLAEEKRKRDEAEAKRKAEEERKRQEAEARRLAEEERQRKEADLRARLAAEENQRRLSTLREAYITAIRQKVERNWTRPAGSGKMPPCKVHVKQIPGGFIEAVIFEECAGSTGTYRASIENAVRKAEPLPKPSDPALFERDIKFTFRPIE